MTGFIRRTDLSRDRAEQRADRFAVGEKVDAIVTSVDKNVNYLCRSKHVNPLRKSRPWQNSDHQTVVQALVIFLARHLRRKKLTMISSIDLFEKDLALTPAKVNR